MLELLTLYGPYIVAFVLPYVLAKMGIKLPITPSPLLPLPDSKSPLLDLLKLILQWRDKPDSLTPSQKELIKVMWFALPEEEPK